MQYDIFISYRRDGGDMMAHVLYERLTQRGYSVFQDVETLRSGKFNTAIYEKIEQCKNVILILPPNSLDRCENEEDWVRKEIVCAIKNKKNIIPVLLRGFVWPEKLPDDMDEIRFYNGIAANTEYFDQFLDKLTDFLVTSSLSKKEKGRLKQKHSVKMFITGCLALVALALPLLVVFALHKPFDLLWRIIYFFLLVILAKAILYAIETRPEIAAMCFGTLTEDDLRTSPDVVFSCITSAFGKNVFISKREIAPFTCLYVMKRLVFGTWDGRKTNYVRVLFRRTLEWYDPSVFHLHALSKSMEAVKMLTRQGFILQSTPAFISANVDYLVKDTFHVFLFYDYPFESASGVAAIATNKRSNRSTPKCRLLNL